MKRRWCYTRDLFYIANFSNSRSKALWPSGLVNCLVRKKFGVQSPLWSMGFLIQNKSPPRHHRSLKLGSKLKYPNKNWNIIIGWSDTVWCYSLTLSWRESLSYRNQSIDLFYKSMDWFLYDRDLRHERVKQYFS